MKMQTHCLCCVLNCLASSRHTGKRYTNASENCFLVEGFHASDDSVNITMLLLK